MIASGATERHNMPSNQINDLDDDEEDGYELAKWDEQAYHTVIGLIFKELGWASGGPVSSAEELLERYRNLKKASKELTDKLDLMNENPQFKGIWVHLWAHGMEYKGPQYGEELKKLKEILDTIEKP